MAKKPARVFRKADGKMVQVDPGQTTTDTPLRPAVPVYRKATDSDRMRITQRIVDHSETAQARREEGVSLFDALFHSIYDAAFVTNAQGVIQAANVRAEQSFMLTSEDLCGMEITELISGADEQLLQTIRDNVDNRRFAILEAVCLRADDTRFYSEIVVNRLTGQDPNAWCVLVRDSTDRKEAERELMVAQEHLTEARENQRRSDALSKAFHALYDPLQILLAQSDLEGHAACRKQAQRIVEIMNEIQAARDPASPSAQEAPASALDNGDDEIRTPMHKRILIVDDERLIRELFATALSKVFPDLTIDVAADGKEACERFERQYYGVIVMDGSMPVMGGDEAFATIRRICEAKRWQLPPFIFFTGYAANQNLQAIVEANPIHTRLVKPLEISALVKAVQQSLSAPSQPRKRE